MSKKVKVLLVENDSDFTFLIKKIIMKDERLEYVGQANHKELCVEMARKFNPDIVLMDLNLTGNEFDGIEAAKEIRLTTSAKVLLLTSFEQPDIILDASKRAFASGYVFKSQCYMLTDMIYATATSNTSQELFIKELSLKELTAAEQGVLRELVDGKVNGFSSSAKTIANQKTSIFKKLGLKHTDDLIRLFKK